MSGELSVAARTSKRPEPGHEPGLSTGPDVAEARIVDHDLRIETRWLDAVRSGGKRAEVRYNDRDYRLGDVLCLSDGDGSLLALVTHVLPHYDVPGLRTGWVVLSLQTIPDCWRPIVARRPRLTERAK